MRASIVGLMSCGIALAQAARPVTDAMVREVQRSAILIDTHKT